MCLVSVCPKGTKKNTEEVYAFIRQGAQSNSSGSGFMFKRNGENTITVDKGYFVIESLIKALKEYDLQEDDELVIHHRIPTSGNVNNLNCHPFVISQIHEEVVMLKGNIDKPVLAHNGVFSSIKEYEALNTEFSDTYAFARYVMADTNLLSMFNNNRDLFNLLIKDVLSYNKVAILSPDKDVTLLGRWEECNGYKHSNTGYKTYTYDRGGSSTRFRSGTGFSNKGKVWNGFDFEKEVIENEDVDDSTSNMRCQLGMGSTNAVLNLGRLPNKLIHFTCKNIKITKENCKDFEFIKQTAFEQAQKTSLDTSYLCKYNLEEFNEHLTTQTLRQDSGHNISYLYIATVDLLLDYVFIPKSNKRWIIYESFNSLLLANIKHSKNSMKTLKIALDKSYKKREEDLVIYKKTGHLYPKKALQMYYDFLVKQDVVNKKLESNNLKILI